MKEKGIALIQLQQAKVYGKFSGKSAQPHFQMIMCFIEKPGLDTQKWLLTNRIPPVEMRLNEKTGGK